MENDGEYWRDLELNIEEPSSHARRVKSCVSFTVTSSVYYFCW
jgi:hypothetical protein